MKRALSILLAALLLLAAVPTVAEEDALKAGLYVSEAGTEFMYLNEEGVGVLNYKTDQYYANGVVWTETSLEIEREAVPYAVADGVLSFTYDDVAMALRYSGTWDAFALGDQGTAYAGEYAAENGKKMTLTADGHGTFDGKPIFWGSLMPYWKDVASESDCFILFGSYLSGMFFADGTATVDTEAQEQIVFAPVAAPKGTDVDVPVDVPVDAPVDVPDPAKMTVISPAFDLSLSLPTDRWTVRETEAGLLVALEKGPIQYTFLSIALEKEPNPATLDAYADLVWKDALMGAGVAYDPAETVRSDHAVGEAAGRTAATEWTQDGAVLLGDAILWYANGRLYVALCASNEVSRPEALAVLDEALLTVRTAEEGAQALTVRLPLDKEVFDQVRELPPVVPVSEKVYYGYKITSEGHTYDLVPLLVIMGMDPKSFSLTLRSDGTGRALLMDESDAMEFNWAEEAFLVDGEEIFFIPNPALGLWIDRERFDR